MEEIKILFMVQIQHKLGILLSKKTKCFENKEIYHRNPEVLHEQFPDKVAPGVAPYCFR